MHLPADYTKYAIQKESGKYMIRSAQAQYDKTLIQKLNSNPNALYEYKSKNQAN